MEYEKAIAMYPVLEMDTGDVMECLYDDISDSPEQEMVECHFKLIEALYAKADILPEVFGRVYMPDVHWRHSDISVDSIMTERKSCDMHLHYGMRPSADEIYRTEHYTWELHTFIIALTTLTYDTGWDDVLEKSDDELKEALSNIILVIEGEDDDCMDSAALHVMKYLALLKRYKMQIPDELAAPYKKERSFGFISYAVYVDTILSVVRKDLCIASDECFAWIMPKVLDKVFIPYELESVADCLSPEDEYAVVYSGHIGEYLSSREALPEDNADRRIMDAAVNRISSVFDTEEKCYEGLIEDHYAQDGYCMIMNSGIITEICHCDPLFGAATDIFEAAYQHWKNTK